MLYDYVIFGGSIKIQVSDGLFTSKHIEFFPCGRTSKNIEL